MTRAELEHAIRAACDVAEDTEVYVFGSQAILGEHPDAPEALRTSAEADVMPKNHPDRVDDVDGALGELSRFHETHGFYVHDVSTEAAILPEGWQSRCIPVRNSNTRGHTAWCLETPDLAASKLVAFRDKDREFIRVLLREAIIDAARLKRRMQTLRIDAEIKVRLLAWLDSTARELGRER